MISKNVPALKNHLQGYSVVTYGGSGALLGIGFQANQ